MGIQVSELTKGKMPWQKEFIDFTFDGHKISEYGLVAVVDGDRYSLSLSSEFQDEVSEINGRNGQIFWGTKFKTKKREYTLATDGMTERQLTKFKTDFAPGKYGQLMEDSFFGRYSYCRVAEQPKLSFVAFRDTDIAGGEKFQTNVFKGEIKITFVQDDPFSYSVQNINQFYLEDLASQRDSGIPGDNDTVMFTKRLFEHSTIPYLDSWENVLYANCCCGDDRRALNSYHIQEVYDVDWDKYTSNSGAITGQDIADMIRQTCLLDYVNKTWNMTIFSKKRFAITYPQNSEIHCYIQIKEQIQESIPNEDGTTTIKVREVKHQIEFYQNGIIKLHLKNNIAFPIAHHYSVNISTDSHLYGISQFPYFNPSEIDSRAILDMTIKPTFSSSTGYIDCIADSINNPSYPYNTVSVTEKMYKNSFVYYDEKVKLRYTTPAVLYYMNRAIELVKCYTSNYVYDLWKVIYKEIMHTNLLQWITDILGYMRENGEISTTSSGVEIFEGTWKATLIKYIQLFISTSEDSKSEYFSSYPLSAQNPTGSFNLIINGRDNKATIRYRYAKFSGERYMPIEKIDWSKYEHLRNEVYEFIPGNKIQEEINRQSLAGQWSSEGFAAIGVDTFGPDITNATDCLFRFSVRDVQQDTWEDEDDEDMIVGPGSWVEYTVYFMKNNTVVFEYSYDKKSIIAKLAEDHSFDNIKFLEAEENCSDCILSDYLKLEGGNSLDENGKIESYYLLLLKKGGEAFAPEETKLTYRYTYL